MGVINTIEVDAHHLVELSRSLFQKVGFQTQDSGATDEDIQPAKPLDRLCNGSPDGRLVGDVGRHGDGSSAQRLDGLYHIYTFFFQQIGDDNVATLFGQAEGARPTDTPGTTGDYGHAVFFGSGKSKIWHYGSIG